MLIRLWGEPTNKPEPTQQNATAEIEPTQHALIAELQALRAELRELREEVKELRRLPAPAQKVEQSPAPDGSNSKQRHQFSDLIDALKKNQG
uniref:hypothetical protein n=1 Tax=Halomonas sp. Ant2 TaxID=1630300 RepID=UPI001564DB0F|nr:hypothetical protein [Halomonas sp. Ant2]